MERLGYTLTNNVTHFTMLATWHQLQPPDLQSKNMTENIMPSERSPIS